MTLIEIRKAIHLLNNYINGAEQIFLNNGALGLQAYFKDGTQKVFEDIQHVIDWVQVRKIMQYMH